MIKLAVKDYCQACNSFQPILMESAQTDETGIEHKVYEVRCERWELCANVARMSRGMSMEAGKRSEPHQSPAATASPEGKPLGNVVDLHGVVAEVR